MNTALLKTTFWINETKIYTKSEGLSITQACTFEYQRQQAYSMETKLEYLFDCGNILNMFEIQKY